MQQDSLFEFRMYKDVAITIDIPRDYDASKKTLVIFYALANGNSTLHTIGNTKDSLYDWSLNIQHIGAQTKFIRKKLPEENIVVAYLANDLRAGLYGKQNMLIIFLRYKISLTQFINSLNRGALQSA